MTARMLGSELEIGDTVEVWWAPNRDTITGLRPYKGPIPELAGASIASFALNTIGMTIEPGALFNVIARPSGLPEQPPLLSNHEIRHDLHGFYVCTLDEAKHEDEGNASIGFDGRPHFDDALSAWAHAATLE